MLLPAFASIASALIGGVVAVPPEPPAQTQAPVLLAALTLRTFPAEARRGKMQQVADGMVLIDGKALRLAPAAQIRSANNLIVMPSTAQTMPLPTLVRYQTDNSGAVYRIWMLTPDEAAAAR
jgi:hypothetical protein